MTEQEMKEHTSEKPNEGVLAEIVAWMCSRPESVQRMMVRLPPACVVTAKKDLGILKPGEYAVVRSIFEDGVHVTIVVDGFDEDDRDVVHADDLEVVGYRYGLTPERVKEIVGP